MTTSDANRMAARLVADFTETTVPDPFCIAHMQWVADSCEDLRWRARLLARLACSERFRDPRRSVALADEGMALARRFEPGPALLDALRAATAVRATVNHLDEVELLAVELAELAISLRSPPHHAHALLCQLFVATSRGLACRRRSVVAQLHQLVDRWDDPAARSFLYQAEAQQAIATGRWADAREGIDAALEAATQAENDLALQCSVAGTLLLGWLRSVGDATPEALADGATRDPWISGWAGAQLIVESRPGRQAEVGRLLATNVGPDLGDLPGHTLWLGQLMLFAEAARFSCDPARGRMLRELLWPHRTLHGTLGDAICLGSAWLGVAVASDAAGDVDRALAEYDRAAKENEAAGYVLWAVFARARAAELVAREGLEDADRRVHAALSECRELGVVPLVIALESLERSDPLTEREREILAELAGGLSNREMADRLFISVKTVERHLANIFCKLGLSSRVEAALWARDTGLVPVSA